MKDGQHRGGRRRSDLKSRRGDMKTETVNQLALIGSDPQEVKRILDHVRKKV